LSFGGFCQGFGNEFLGPVVYLRNISMMLTVSGHELTAINGKVL